MSALAVEQMGEERRAAVLPFPEILSETAHLLLQEVDPDTLCQSVFRRLLEPFGVDVYFHYLLSQDGTHLELASSGGNPAARAAIGSTLNFNSAVCGVVAQQRTPIYVSDVHNRTDAMTSLVRSMGAHCYACQPLLIRGRLLGTLSFGSTLRSEFTPQELELFALVAQQVSIATDRREQSERLRDLERLAAVGRTSAALAHEINNPLETLGNLLYLLHDEVQGSEGEKLLHQAEGLIHQLAGTVRNTLEIFRGGHTRPHTVNLTELAHTLAAGLILPNHARLESSIEPDLCVRAVPGELRQVLYNLLTNAAHFTPAGTAVTLSVYRANNQAEIRVRDEGTGISEESRPKLFQPFFTTRGKDGTGIGLWLSRQMMQRVGGTLRFESDPALRPGTEFIATLPLA